ncbi:MAG: sigma-70 family RNA polymerase sigma factor [Planctomycetaceae bacterium]|nr:sigma-70 family RNA polymerase sigma factor [Planctomycetaceae bacterium]
MTESTDHELMQQIGQGSTPAFDELVRRWQGPLARIVSRLAGGDAQEDLCQEVFVKVYLARKRYRCDAPFSTWLYRIAVNVARDRWRRQRGWLSFVDRLVTWSPEPSPDVRAAEAESHTAVRQAIDKLPLKQREALVLKHFGELTFPEVAQALNIPLSTAKSRVEAGLIELRRELTRYQDRDCRTLSIQEPRP